MKAIVVREFGPPSVMRYEEVPTPEPGPGEVLIKVHAVSVNRTLDAVVRAGKYAKKVELPLTPGVDPSGIVAKVGPDVTMRKVGDRVTVQLRTGNEAGMDSIRNLGVHAWGGYAEYVRARADRTAIVPDALDFATATVVSRHAPTGIHLLRDRAKLQAGEWALVMGAAGGLGSAGVQIAKYLGAKVIAAAGTDERVKVGLEFGADAGVNYRAQDLAAEVMKITGGTGVNVVFENIGDPDLFPKALASMARKGRLVTAFLAGFFKRYVEYDFTADLEAKLAFYQQVLGMVISDRSEHLIAFLRSPGGSDHHVIAIIQDEKLGFHHASFEVDDIDRI